MPTSPPQEIEVHSMRSGKDDVVADNLDTLSTTVNNSPSPAPPPPLQQGNTPQARQLVEYSSWTTSLCGCISDMRLCCLVFWCPCIAFGRIVEITDKGTSSCCACGSLYFVLNYVVVQLCVVVQFSTIVPHATHILLPAFIYLGRILTCIYRGKLKQNLNIRPNCLEDCCCHFCCEDCALCQEYRELQNRGYDLSLGWEGNMIASNPRDLWPPVAPIMNR